MGGEGIPGRGERDIRPPAYFVEQLVALQRQLFDAVARGRGPSQADQDAESAVVREGATGTDYSGDTIYRIDQRSEDALLEFCETWSRQLQEPFVLVAEGLPGDGRMLFPHGADPADATFECIVDPIDGTRGIMYDKRSAWALAAIAPGARELGRAPRLGDIVVAVQTELPTSRARLADTLWAIKGEGAHRVTRDIQIGEEWPARLVPSRATSLAHGFATVTKFFPGTKERAAWLEERLFERVVGDHAGGAPLVFDDEYISSGGQLYELMVGHDRFVADLRPALMDARGLPGERHAGQPAVRRLCARPYDLCTALIAQEAGVAITDGWGKPLDVPLDTASDVAWIGYANSTLRAQVEPVLQELLRELGVPEP